MAKKISEYGEKTSRKCGPHVAPTRMWLPLLLISATLPWGKRNKFMPMIPTYVLAVVNDDLVSPRRRGGSPLPFRGEQQVLVERVGENGHFHPLAAAGDDGEDRGP